MRMAFYYAVVWPLHSVKSMSAIQKLNLIDHAAIAMVEEFQTKAWSAANQLPV
jgi:hypothetical protein